MTRLLLCAALLGCGGAPTDPLADRTVRPLPEWTDRYAGMDPGDPRQFEIEALMREEQLTRLQAVELQNHYRDLARASADGDPAKRYAEALARVRAGDFESGLDPAALAKAPFIVVFDLDDTLYDQYRTSPGCADLSYPLPDGKARHIKFAPGWDAAIKRIRAAGGLVALFSANQDDPTRENLRQAQLDGRPLLGHPDIAGVLTNSYLVLQTKFEGEGRENPRKGQPVLEPSKDLRVFDETLQRVIIVDDNPTRLFQFANAREFKKFHADTYCAGGSPEAAAWDAAMTTVADEIVEAAAYATTAQVPFQRAYLPYTTLGRIAVRWLAQTPGWDEAQARAHLRAHPELADTRF